VRWRAAPEIPPDPILEGERERIWRGFWRFVGSGQAGVFMLVIGGLGGVTAGYLAQTKDLDPLATGEWAVAGVIGVPLLFCLAVLLATWRGTLKAQRDDARAEVLRLRRPEDSLARLSEDLGSFVLRVDATKPAHLPIAGDIFTKDGMLAIQAAQRQEAERVDEWWRRNMAEYHADLRQRLVEYLRQPGREQLRADYIKLVNVPSSLADLKVIGEALGQVEAGGPNDEGEDRQPQIRRQAIGRVLVELDVAKGAIQRACAESTWWVEPLSLVAWQQTADMLAEAGFTKAHKATRVAYRHIADLNQRAGETREAMEASFDYDPPPGLYPSTGGGLNEEFAATVHAIELAEAELESVESESLRVAADIDRQPGGLAEALSEADKEGSRVLADAASLEPLGNLGFRDDLLRRADAWIDRVSDALSKHDERDMLLRWTNDPRWLYGTPQPITREQIQRLSRSS
jgi:hypothetical protein